MKSSSSVVRLAGEILEGMARDGRLPCPNTLAVLTQRIESLEEALDQIFHHAYDDTTPHDEILADFDGMREIAKEALK